MLHYDAIRSQMRIFFFSFQRQRPEIIVQVACPTPNGSAELEYLSMLPDRTDWVWGSPQPPRKARQEPGSEEAILFLGIFWIANLVLFWAFFCLSTTFTTGKKKKIVRSTNKPWYLKIFLFNDGNSNVKWKVIKSSQTKSKLARNKRSF